MADLEYKGPKQWLSGRRSPERPVGSWDLIEKVKP